ncbi:MAG: oligosaccharide flippase family protein [Muribaculaceae bacterium]
MLKGIGQNNKIILKNGVAAFIIKGLALLISFFSVPAFIHYFDNNTYLGVWYTLLSVLIWFLNFDLGIGNGIRNSLVKAFVAKDDEMAKHIISSGLFSISIVSLMIFSVGVIIFNIIDLQWIFNVADSVISKQTITTSVVIVFGAIILRFILTTVSSVFYAIQESRINNFLGLCISILLLLYVLIFHFEDKNDALIYLSYSYLILSNLPIIIAAIIIFNTRLRFCKPSIKFIDKKSIKQIMKIGSVFFVCQILYMLIVNTNEFFIAKFYNPTDVVDYTFYYKIMSLASMLVMLAMTPIWSVVTKAFEEHNYNWLYKLLNQFKIIGIILFISELFIVLFLQNILDLWLGKNSITVDYYIAFSFAIFGWCFAYSSMLSTIVCGLAKMKLQLYCYLIGVIIKIALIIILSTVIESWILIVWTNIIILLPYSILQQLDLEKYLSKLIYQK